MCHLHCCGMRLEMIVDPSREDGRFHSHCPWLGKRLHPQVQSQSRGGYRAFCIDTATAVLHAVVDRFLVNIQTDVVHSLHGGASLVVSESAWSLSSAFLHQAPLHDLFIQTIRELIGSLNTSAFLDSNLPTRRHYFRFPRHPTAIADWTLPDLR